MAAPVNHEYDDVKNWIDIKLKKLQISETCRKQKDSPMTHEIVEEERKDEENGLENILDPLSKSRKGRPRKNRIKPQVGRVKRNLIMMAMSQILTCYNHGECIRRHNN